MRCSPLKRLGQFLGPVVLVNTNNYFNRFVEFLEHSVSERFMSRLHLEMWSVVDEPEQVLAAMSSAKEPGAVMPFQVRRGKPVTP